jgi:drug/metabolite transporter (DMT)-like permease
VAASRTVAVAVVLALLAALSNASATVLQRIGVEEAVRRPPRRGRWLAGVLRRPLWFAGLGLMALSFFGQAVALSFAGLSVVEPVMVTELVFLLVILGLRFRQPLGWREWAGSGGTALGLGAFLGLSAGRPGEAVPRPGGWLWLVVASAGAALVSLCATRRGGRSWRAGWFGVAAGLSFALSAACTRASAEIVAGQGFARLFLHLEPYGVAAFGLGGLLATQYALRAGPVAASQSAVLIVNPLASVVMGVWLFRDHLRGGGRAPLEVAALACMCLGLYVLSHSPLLSGGADEALTVGPGLGERLAGPH